MLSCCIYLSAEINLVTEQRLIVVKQPNFSLVVVSVFVTDKNGVSDDSLDH